MSGASGDAGIKTFLIADVRGYTLFTQQRGDEQAAKLAAKFADVAREVIEQREGSVIELRGDEALAVFGSPRQAIRAAVDLQSRFLAETRADPSLPLGVGVGLDAGEAVPVQGGYRGGALNLAARLCSMARPGEILATPEVIHFARTVEGVTYRDSGDVRLKGLVDPVRVIKVASVEDVPRMLEALLQQPRSGPGTPPPERPGGKRKKLLAASAGALALVVTLVLFLLLRGGGGGAPNPRSTGKSHTSGQAGPPPPSSAVEIDPSKKKIVRVVPGIPGLTQPLPVKPRIAFGENGVWIGTYGFLVHLDEQSGEKVGDTIPISGVTGTGFNVVVADRAVWVTGESATAVSRFDPTTHHPLPSVRVNGGLPSTMVLGDGYIWVGTRQGVVVRIDPTVPGKPLTMKTPATAVDAMAYGQGAVWFVDNLAGDVYRVDPKTAKLSPPISVPGSVDEIAAGAGNVWLLDNILGTVSWIDPSTNRVAGSTQVGHDPSSIAVGLGAAWVADKQDGNVYRISSSVHDVTSFKVGGSLGPIGVDQREKRLWVAVYRVGRPNG